MAEKPTIVIDTEASDDWMKDLPGYQDEVAIHDELAKEFAAQAEKGGPDSGYHRPHYGRPGKVGGSRPRIVGMTDQERAWLLDALVADEPTAEERQALWDMLSRFPVQHLEGLEGVNARTPEGYGLSPEGDFYSGVWTIMGVYNSDMQMIYVAPAVVADESDLERILAHELGHHVSINRYGLRRAGSLGKRLADFIAERKFPKTFDRAVAETFGLRIYSFKSGLEMWADAYGVWCYGSDEQWDNLTEMARKSRVDLEGTFGPRSIRSAGLLEMAGEKAMKRYGQLVTKEIEGMLATVLEPVDVDPEIVALTPWLYVEIGDDIKGGEGSGHFGHEGRPGKVGGSKPSGLAPVQFDAWGRVIGKAPLAPKIERIDSPTPDDRAKLFGEVSTWGDDRRSMALAATIGEVSKGKPLWWYTMRDQGELVGIISCGVWEDWQVAGYHMATKRSGYGRRLFTHVLAEAARDGKGFFGYATDLSVGFYRALGIPMEWGKKINLSLEDVQAWLDKQASAKEAADHEPENGIFLVWLQETGEDAKGGPDSGYHDPHLGRPGKVGGSRPRQVDGSKPSGGALSPAVVEWEDKILAKARKRLRKTEIGVIIGQDGQQLWGASGSKTRLNIEYDNWDDYKGAVLTHYHPSFMDPPGPKAYQMPQPASAWSDEIGAISLSFADVRAGLLFGFSEVRAVGAWFGKRVLYRMTFDPSFRMDSSDLRKIKARFNVLSVSDEARLAKTLKERLLVLHNFWEREAAKHDVMDYSMEVSEVDDV